jgi:hypothetical protein
LGAFAGVALQNHWGAATCLLIPVWIAARLWTVGRLDKRRVMAGALVVQLAAAAWFIRTAQHSDEFHFDFPVNDLATQAQSYWQQRCGSAPAILTGPDWEIGALAMALHPHPDLIPSADRRVAPQVRDQDIQERGVLVLWREGDDPQALQSVYPAAPIVERSSIHAVGTHGKMWSLGIGIIEPSAGCHPSGTQ